MACQLKIITPFSDEAVVLGNEQAVGRGDAILPTASNTAYAAAERRRQLALRALDERLQVNTVSEEVSDEHGTADTPLQISSNVK